MAAARNTLPMLSRAAAIGGILIAIFGMVAGGSGALAAEAAAPGTSVVCPADADVLSDRPLAVWRFDERDGATHAVAERFPAQAAVERPNDTGRDGAVDAGEAARRAMTVEASVAGAVTFGEPGPRPPRHPHFGPAGTAALFGRQGVVKLGADTPGFEEFQCSGGDSITLEAWVYPFAIGDGQQVYVVGKGRTGRKGFAENNQNWALRLAGQAGRALPSFLFRAAANRPGTEEDFHRWTASEGFEPGTGWHHVAVSYTFGEKDSLRGYLDGRPVEGSWDMGGATTAAPVVDDDEVWLGSALGTAEANGFIGLLDNVAIHSRTLPPDRIAARWRVNEEVSAVVEPEVTPVPEGSVLFELVEGVSDAVGWRFAPRAATESFSREWFAISDLPLRYDETGVRADRRLPLVMRARGRVQLPPGPQRIRVRTRGETRVLLDGRELARLDPPGHRTEGFEKMFVPGRSGPAGMRIVQPGDREALVDVEGDGDWHMLHVEVKLGARGRRPEPGEFSVSVGPPDTVPRVIAVEAAAAVPLTDAGWASLATRLAAETETANTAARRTAMAKQAGAWEERHDRARHFVAAEPGPAVPVVPADRPELAAATFNEVDRFVNAALAAAGVPAAPLVSDEAFIRRLSLDVRGLIPTPAEIADYLGDRATDRRQKLVDRFLEDPRWADHWTAYWQDVLAENPNIVNPTLNNTGPFRFWIHESFLDRKPIDRFVTELIMMEGSKLYGGPAGFGMASENDVPMAAKAHVLARAFLGVETGCARCHDAPGDRVLQRDLFGLAAMLKRAPEKVPATSSVPVSPERLATMAIKVTLPPGSAVEPAWPFGGLVADDAAQVGDVGGDPRARVAALVTSPANPRFARVIVNRLWARYFGRGLVDNLDDWEGEEPSHPELLDWLARRLVLDGYRLEEVARLILTSHAYGRGSAADADGGPSPAALWAGRPPRRASAEQVLDSLAVASGKPFDVEPMNIDLDTSRLDSKALNLGRPTRAWQFATLGNERDRPSLSLPFAQHSVTLMEAFGWRGERQNPISERETDPNALQPAIIANGVAVKRACQFSEGSGFTAAALEDRSVESFIDEIFLRILSRRPGARERDAALALVAPGYDSRRVPEDRVVAVETEPRPIGVSWSNHLSDEANRTKLVLAGIAARGDPPTGRLDPDWRERAEDLVWTLFNTPEFVFTP